MPTYDYECQRCGTMEIFQSIKDNALAACPQCKSRKFRKLVSRGAGIIFKGEGFWETDYNRSADYRKQASGEASKPEADQSAASAKKPAATASTAEASASGSSAAGPASSSGSPPSTDSSAAKAS